MPSTFANLFRAIIILLLSAHVFRMYALARSMSGDFGREAGTVVIATLFGLVMLVPFVWAVALPDAPEMYTRVFRARRWRTEGRCPQCGYRCGDEQSVCPECGTALRDPEEYRPTWATVRRYVVVNLLAWIIGCLAAETWISRDEEAFRREVSAAVSAGESSTTRARRWPSTGAFGWSDEGGYAVEN